MRPTRRTQPYRKRQPRQPGPTLDAMLRGRPAGMRNPIDMQRRAAKRVRRLKRGR